MTIALLNPTRMRYVNLPRYWTRDIMPHLGDKKLNDILTRDVNKYTMGRLGQPFTRGRLPSELYPGWAFGDYRGKMPRYGQYVLHGACHWLVNFSLRLATLVRPQRPWRIITSDRHSTVWDGKATLFEFNYLAIGVDPDECFADAYDRELAVGEYRKAGYPPHWREAARQKEARATA